MSFSKWINEADMPTQDAGGKWYDAETGIYYEPMKISTKVTSMGALEARNVAKFFGGKALKGSTAKQKAAGEYTRADKIKKVSPEVAEMLCTMTLYENASFWLNNKYKKPSEFEAFALKRIELLNNHKKAKKEKNTDLVAKIAKQYNDLTKEWGFN